MDLIVIAAAVGGLIAVPYWVVSTRRFLRRRASRQAPRATVAEALAHPGRYRIRGTVADSEHLLTSPLTGRRCAYFRLDVQHGFVGDHDVAQAMQSCDFSLSDGTGEIWVLVNGIANDALDHELAKDFVDPGDDDRGLAEALTELGLARPVEGGRYRQIMAFEAALLVGDDIEIVADFKPDLHPHPSQVTDRLGYRDSPRRLIAHECQVVRLREYGKPQQARLGPKPATRDPR